MILIHDDYIRVVIINIRVICPKLSNVNEIPKINKIVFTWTVYKGDQNDIRGVWLGLETFTGQQPVIIKATKHSNYAKKNEAIGCIVSISGINIYKILEDIKVFIYPNIINSNFSKSVNKHGFDDIGIFTYKVDKPSYYLPGLEPYYEQYEHKSNKITKDKDIMIVNIVMGIKDNNIAKVLIQNMSLFL